MLMISVLIALLRPSFTEKLKVWTGMSRGTMFTEMCRSSTVVKPLLTSTVKASLPWKKWMNYWNTKDKPCTCDTPEVVYCLILLSVWIREVPYDLLRQKKWNDNKPGWMQTHRECAPDQCPPEWRSECSRGQARLCCLSCLSVWPHDRDEEAL